MDDHAVVREGIRALLESERDIEVVGEAADGREAVSLAATLDPDVVVMDIGMPRLNGIDATLQLRRSSPRSRVLILSAHSDDPYIERVLALGAVAYIVKQNSVAVLAGAIRKLSRGLPTVSASVRARLRAVSAGGKAPVPGQPPGPLPLRVPRLSPREAEVLQCIAEGRANKQTAGDLGISIKTVEKHRQRLMEKLAVHDVAGLVRYAVAAGVVLCDPPLPRPRP